MSFLMGLDLKQLIVGGFRGVGLAIGRLRDAITHRGTQTQVIGCDLIVLSLKPELDAGLALGLSATAEITTFFF